MKSAVAEISKISELLPPRKTAQLLNYARRLAVSAKSKPKKELDGDAEWERIIRDPRPRPKLEAVRKRIDKLIAEGKVEPMNFNKF
jgi:hypothetical protein